MNQLTPTPPPEWLVTALDAHRQWVAEKQAQQPSVGPHRCRDAGANLVGAVLTRICLAWAHLEAVDFSDARLTEADPTGVKADRATFYDAVFTNCVLARTGGAALTKAQLYETEHARTGPPSSGGRSPGRA
jgi:uncharacterized protein YjbI with pentapeptide repeats